MDNFESDEQNFEGGGGEKSLPSPLLFSTSPPLPSPILRFYPSPPLPSPPLPPPSRPAMQAIIIPFFWPFTLSFFLCQCNQVDIFFILFYANTVTSVRMMKELIPFFDEFRILPFKQMAALTAEVT